jgi:hypothetical protein
MRPGGRLLDSVQIHPGKDVVVQSAISAERAGCPLRSGSVIPGTWQIIARISSFRHHSVMLMGGFQAGRASGLQVNHPD